MQVFAEDLGVQFNAFARESWKLVLLFILTELKRGFTRCLKEKAGIHPAADVTGGCSSSNQANIGGLYMSLFDVPCNGSSTSAVVDNCNRDVITKHVTDDVIDDATDDVTSRVSNNVKRCSSQSETEEDD